MIRCVAFVAVLLLAAPAAAEDVHARVEHTGGDALAGGKIELMILLEWPGRSDRFAPSTPKLPVAKGGSIRLGRSTSSFNGGKTTWKTTAAVTLPERGERWQMGPGTVTVLGAGGVKQEVPIPEIVLGGPSFNPLIGQGIGSGFVVVLILGWFLFRDRQLAAEEATPPPFAAALSRARGAVDPFELVEALEALLALRLDLDGAGVHTAEPGADQLRERLEGVRYGGEEITEQTVCDWLAALETAADGGLG